MDFDAVVREIETLAGSEVDVSLFGPSGGSSIADLSGTLQRIVGPDVPQIDEIPAERAVVFQVGGHHGSALLLSRSRFVAAKRLADDERIEVETLDVRLLIGPRSRPWID